LNDTQPTTNLRFLSSAKGKRTGMKPKMMNIKEISTTGNFSRIYTPQNYMRRDKRLGYRMDKNTSKTKTMMTSELGKKSIEHINISTNKESNMTMKSNSLRKHTRVYSAHQNYFNRLQSANRHLGNGELDRSKFTSMSTKDCKILSVSEESHLKTRSRPFRNCCSAKKVKDTQNKINFAKRLFEQRQEAYKNARHIDATMLNSSKAEMMINYSANQMKNSSIGVNS
jgi:hypothetical protein